MTKRLEKKKRIIFKDSFLKQFFFKLMFYIARIMNLAIGCSNFQN